MGGVAKAVGGAVSGGGKGQNAGPSENTIKNAMIYPELRDPAYRAIQDATKLYQQGYSIPKMNRRQWQGIEGIEDFASQYGGRLEDVLGNVGNIAQGNRQGDAPGDDYLRSIYAGKQGDTDAQNYFEDLFGGKRGDSSHQNYFENLYEIRAATVRVRSISRTCMRIRAATARARSSSKASMARVVRPPKDGTR